MVAEIHPREWPGRLIRIVGGLLLLMTLILIAGRFAARTSWGHHYAISKIEAMQPAGQNIAIRGLDGDLLSGFTIARLEVSDKEKIWLVADGIRVKWTPFDLLKKKLEITALSAAKVSLLEKPLIESAGSETSFQLNQYDLTAFNFPAFYVGPALLPEEQIMSAKGSASYGSKGGRLNLNAVSQGRNPLDNLVADIKWSPELLISGDAKVVGQPGGIVSTLLRLQENAPLTFDMETSGGLENLSTDVVGRIGAVKFATANLTVKDEKQDVIASLKPNLIPVLSPYSEMFGGDIDVKAEINHQEADFKMDGEVTSKNIDAAADALKMKDGFVFQNLKITSRAPKAFAPDLPASADLFIFEGRAITGKTMSASGQVTLEDIAYDAHRIDNLSGPVEISLNGPLLDFNANLVGQLGKENPLTQWGGKTPKFNASGQYNLESKGLALSKADLRMLGLSLIAKGKVDVAQTRATLDGAYTLSKNALGLSLPAKLSGSFSARPNSDGVRLSFKGKARDFTEFPDPLGELLGEVADYSGNAVILKSRHVKISKMEMSGNGLSAIGSGTIDPDKNLTANIKYETQAFALSQLNVASTSGEMDITGRTESLKFDINGNSPAIDFNGRTVSDVAYHVDGERNETVINALIELTGTDSLGLAALETQGKFADGTWNLQQLKSNLFGLIVTGDVSGRGGDLTSLKSVLEITGDPVLFIPAETLELTVQLAGETAVITGDISGVNLGSLENGAISIDARGPRGAVVFSVDVIGDSVINDISRLTEFRLTGNTDLSGPYLSAASNLTGKIGQFAIKSAGPVEVAQTENGYAGQGDVNMLGGKLSFDLDGPSQVFKFDGKNLTLASILSLAGRAGMAGSVDFSGEVSRAESGLNGAMNMDVIDVKQPGSQDEAVDINVKATLLNSDFALIARSQNESLTGQAEIKGVLDTFAKPAFVKWPPENALSGTATASGDIGAIAELFLPAETDVEGLVLLDMKYSLPLDVKGMNGTLKFSGGDIEQGAIGVHLTDISFNAVFNDLSVNVADFSANGKKGGTLTGGGRMGLRDGDTGAITLTAKKLRVLDRPEGSGTLSGSLDFTQDADKLKLKGKLTVDDAALSIDKIPRAGRPTLDVNFASDVPETTKRRNYVTDLDVSIVSAGRISLRGRGLNASLAMNAKFTGPFDAPVLSGDASIVRGRFDFLGKRFELQDSRVVFDDDILQSRLDITAVRETIDLKATVAITGTLDRPVVSLQSEPSRPEDEVLSYILFGRAASQLSALETARLAAALAQLSGGGGFDLLGGLESSLGLDTLDFGQSDTGQTEIKTGKYLSDNVYVEVKSSVEGTPGLAVEWSPKKNIAVKAETSPGDTQRVSVQWKKDFD